MKKQIKSIFITATVVLLAAAAVAVSFAASHSRRARVVFRETVVEVEAEPQDDMMNILFLGTDREAGLCDVMMLINVNRTDSTATVAQIPRDTYARYTDGSYKKLNGAMSALGAGELCKLLSRTMCVDIEGYCVFDLDALVKVVDAIGGVEIDLPFDMDYDDPYQGLSIHLKAGRQTLDGKAAEQFVRYRAGYLRGDLGRMDAQKLFISAFIKKVTESVTPSALIRIIGAVIGDVRTNLGIVDITRLAVTALGVKAENMTMVTMAGSDIRASSRGAWYYVISKSAAVRVLNEFMGVDILPDDFDREGLFMNPSNAEFQKIYDSDLPYYPINAAELEKNGIDIEKH